MNEMNTTTGNSTNSNLGSIDITVMASNYINLFLGLPTNGYVLWLIVSGVGGTIESEFFALNLTVSEILFCVYSILFLIQFFHPMPTETMFFFAGMLYAARPLFQTCICLERYLAVVHPVVFLRYRPLRYRLACCSVVWLLVILMCIFEAFGYVAGEYVYLGVGLPLLVLVLVQLFFCISVLRVLRQSGPGEGGGSNIKSRAFKIILLILITTLITYFPVFITIGLLYLCNFPREPFVFAWYISMCIAIMCGLVQPLLFFHRTGKLPCLNMAP